MIHPSRGCNVDGEKESDSEKDGNEEDRGEQDTRPAPGGEAAH
jgi:hypothetical protein